MQSPSAAFPSPKGGASLILTFRLQSKTTLILGSNSLAASRAFSALEADSEVVIIANGGLENACEELRWRASQSQLTVLDWHSLPSTSTSKDRDIEALESYLKTSNSITLVCITDTVIGGDSAQTRTRESASQIYKLCQTRNILVNVSDMPELCDFSFASVHRFINPVSDQSTPLQVATTTNGQGCRLAGRIRREIVAKLPQEVGVAVEKMGKLRTMAKASDGVLDSAVDSELNEDNGILTPNLPVPLRGSTETSSETAHRRMKWVAQLSEYWPFARLAAMTEEEMQNVLSSEGIQTGFDPKYSSSGLLKGAVHAIHSLTQSHSPALVLGKIFLVGSGPGHPSLLTLATYNALTMHANLVLSDKLVPAAVLELIPPNVEVRIARKFPGNADGAQVEMMESAVEAARRGLTVVRVSLGQTHQQRISDILGFDCSLSKVIQ
jgi:uroporphyrin-III C-methyltransferase